MDMDLASRLKMFINKLGIANSEFADRAGIPRPTLSQLLTGRNKSVNDSFIKKLHETYPTLNIAWLLFAEGDMEIISNIQTSEGENNLFAGQVATQSPGNQAESQLQNQNIAIRDYSSEKSKMQNSANIGSIIVNSTDSQLENSTIAEDSANTAENAMTMLSQKKVESIMVFYSDNSFEIFKPSGEQK
jgi:transcriptional regulator with XRE-family HTH domain